jgi:hypothetical protein
MLPRDDMAFVLYAPIADGYPQYIYPFDEYETIERKTTESLRAIQAKINNREEFIEWERQVRHATRASRL